MSDSLSAQKIRMLVDGELSPGETLEIERLLAERPELKQHVHFERNLKMRMKQAVDSPPAPAEVRERVLQAIAAPELAGQAGTAPLPQGRGPVEASEPATAQSAAVSDQAGGSLVHRFVHWFQGTPRISYGAVAAVLVLTGLVVLASIVSPRIDEIGGPSPVLSDQVSTVSQYASNEHSRCSQDQTVRQSKLHALETEAASALLADHFGRLPLVADLSGCGYEFVGAGCCKSTCGGDSVHLMYSRPVEPNDPRRLADAGRAFAMASIFITPNQGQFTEGLQRRGMKCIPGRPYPVGKQSGCKRQVYLVTDDAFAYLIVSCVADDLEEIVELVRNQIVASVR